MIYFVVALKDEVPDFSFERFLGEDFQIIYTGVGKVNATLHLTEAILKERPTLVINVGTAGTPKHKIGDVFFCNDFIDGDLTEIESVKNHIVSQLPPKYEEIFKPTGSVTTKDTFANYSEPIVTDAADMECFAYASVCNHFSIPFVAIKIVTDIIGQTSVSLWEEQLPMARELTFKILNELSQKEA